MVGLCLYYCIIVIGGFLGSLHSPAFFSVKTSLSSSITGQRCREKWNHAFFFFQGYECEANKQSTYDKILISLVDSVLFYLPTHDGKFLHKVTKTIQFFRHFSDAREASQLLGHQRFKLILSLSAA